MKKRLLLDRPYVGDRGQYTFFDDASTDYLDSNGIPQNYDKFSDKDLYSVSQDDTINNYMEIVREYQKQLETESVTKIKQIYLI